jgi:hypothetical protein
MKKMVRWYNTLKAQNIEITLPEIDAEEDDKEDASTEA